MQKSLVYIRIYIKTDNETFKIAIIDWKIATNKKITWNIMCILCMYTCIK